MFYKGKKWKDKKKDFSLTDRFRPAGIHEWYASLRCMYQCTTTAEISRSNERVRRQGAAALLKQQFLSMCVYVLHP